MSQHDTTQSNGSTRERIINHALIELHNTRTNLIRELSANGTAGFQTRYDTQQALLNTYYALKPLRHKSAVANNQWWTTVQLSEHWTQPVQTTEPRVTGDIQTGTKIVEDRVINHEPVQGLDTLEALPGTTTDRERPKRSMRGRTQDTETVPQVLPSRILLDVASTLEDAAGKLGFEPDVKEARRRYHAQRDDEDVTHPEPFGTAAKPE